MTFQKSSSLFFRVFFFFIERRMLKSTIWKPQSFNYSGLTVAHPYFPFSQLTTTFLFLFTDKNKLIPEVIPFIISHWGKCSHNASCSNLFQVSEGRTPTSVMYKREKPVELYKLLINMYQSQHSWILDLCSGAGK